MAKIINLLKAIPLSIYFFIVLSLLFCFISVFLPQYKSKQVSSNIENYKHSIYNHTFLLGQLSISISEEKVKNDYLKDVVATAAALRSSAGKRLSADEAYKYAEVIVKESNIHHIDPILVVAVIHTESNFKENAKSHKGAKGLMQLLPDTAMYINKKVNKDIQNPKDLYNAETNLRLGIAYLDYLLKKTNGNLEYALVAYNMGPANLYRAISRNKVPTYYSGKVMKKYRELHGVIEGMDMASKG